MILFETGNHADFHQFVGSRPYVYYYHLWLVDIPHLSYLAVPKLSAAVFQISTTTVTNQDDDEQDDADSIDSNGSSVADENLSIISPPVVVQQRRGVSTPSSSMSSRNTGKTGLVKATNKVHLLQLHLHTLEKLQIEAAAQQKEKHVRDGQLALTVELKTVEEMLVMKKNELKAFDSDVDSESEKAFVCNQIKKLRKKQRTLTALVYASDDEDKL